MIIDTLTVSAVESAGRQVLSDCPIYAQVIRLKLISSLHLVRNRKKQRDLSNSC